MFTTVRMPRQRPRPVGAIEDAIADIKAGKMVILMDDENRENEGDLCMAAEAVTPEAINFMAKYGRGLICLTLTEEKIRDLGLPMMAAENRAPLGTAFTVSIDARHGIKSGISAADRARTILTAVRDDARPEDLAVPGHIFPLRAKRGGVLVRTGQTEGSVDLARLAGAKPAGVICEIMKDDGTMARLSDLQQFAATHDVRIYTIADLVQYRLRCDSLVHRVAEAKLNSRYGGDFRICVYHTDVDDGEHVVLIKGDIKPEVPALVRAHAEFVPGDVFSLAERDTAALLHEAMQTIAAEGSGVVLYLRRDGRGPELLDSSRGREASKRRRRNTNNPSTDPSTQERDFREYGIGAQILRDVGLGKIRLLSNFPRNLVSLPGYGLEVVDCVALKVRPQGTKKLPQRRKSPPTQRRAG